MKELKKHYVWAIVVTFMVLVVSLFQYNAKTIKYEGEISCNTGLIDIDFDSYWDNQPYKDNITISTKCNENGCINREVRVTKYYQQWLPQAFNWDKIENLNCNMRFKGEVPLKTIGGLYK